MQNIVMLIQFVKIRLIFTGKPLIFLAKCRYK